MTTPDAGRYGRLEKALEAHHGDTAAYERLGRQLRDRRFQLDPRYANRNRFARERLAPLSTPDRATDEERARSEMAASQLLYNLESGGKSKRHGEPVRKGFKLPTILLAARAYEIEPGSVADVLDGTGDLEPSSREDAAPLSHAPAPPSPAVTGHDSMRLLMQSPGYQEAVAPFYEPIRDRILHLPPGTPATGQNVFSEPGEEFWAAQWDQLSRQPKADGTPMTADDVAVSIATIQAVLAARQSGSGETRAGLGWRAVIAQLVRRSGLPVRPDITDT